MKHPRVAILGLVSIVSAFASSASAGIDWVTIGNPGNAAQSAFNRSLSFSEDDGYGGVASAFGISRDETTIAQYAAFLNAKAASDPDNLCSNQMASEPAIAGITRSGSDGSFSYTVNGSANLLTDVGAYGADSQSYYGINDMAGELLEWNDLDAGPGLSRGLRGGHWLFNEGSLRSSVRGTSALGPTGSPVTGFRVASVQEPSPAVLAIMSTTPVVCDGGGLTGSSGDYQINFSTASGEAGSSPDYRLSTGFCGQLLDAVGLYIEDAGSGGITLDERASRQLEAGLRHDDETSSPLAAELIGWSIEAGPLAGIDSGGLVTAGSVYQDSSALVRAAYHEFGESLAIQVVNTGNDDFGRYAGDGLSDLWQVGYFGEENENGGAASDQDSDGLSNLQEYAFGMNPAQSYGGTLRWSGADLLERGVPMPYASGKAGGFSFRAVFARRRDYIAAGLSYTVEFSGDLSAWKASSSTPAVLADDGEIQVVSVPYPFFVNGKKARFFRVRVESQ